MSLFEDLNLSRKPRLAVILASEAAECGLACMTMVARYHGHDVDLNGLRQRFALSMSGATLRNLMGFADQLGLGPRALRVELDALGKVATPAILHWDLNHFVVLKSVAKGRATIHDPARGAVTLAMEEVSKHFTGVVLELAPTSRVDRIVSRVPVRLNSLWTRSQGFWGAAAQVLALSLALQIVTFAGPFQIQLVVDQAIGGGDRTLLNVLALGFGALILVQAAVEALRAWALQVFGNLLTFQIVGNVVRHLMRLPSDFFEKRHVGDILSRIQSTNAIQDAVTRGIVSTLIDGVMALVAAVIMFFYSPLLAAVVLAGVALNLAVALGYYPVNRARTEEQLVTSARERSHIMETVRAATTIKLMGREAERESAWRNLYGNVINATVSIARLQIGANLLQFVATGVATVLVIFLGARMVMAGAGFSVGMLLAFLSFRQTFSDRMVSLITQGIQFRLLGLHLDRLGDIVASPPEACDLLPPAVAVTGAMSVRQVSFRYGPADPLILKDLDLEIAPGEFLAITGASGGGKTTLLKLLLGLREPTSGTIALEGHPASPELWRAWRTRVGVVAQEDRLMSGTIADNIAFFDPDLDMARVQAVAQFAQVHADIMRMPMQYLSLVGDMGSSLSGGQKQRVLLARALYRQPSILILDEGTANLDESTEAVLADLIASLPITRIVVAHRPALIERAHRVIRIEDGALIEARAAAPDPAYAVAAE